MSAAKGTRGDTPTFSRIKVWDSRGNDIDVDAYCAGGPEGYYAAWLTEGGDLCVARGDDGRWFQPTKVAFEATAMELIAAMCLAMTMEYPKSGEPQ